MTAEPRVLSGRYRVDEPIGRGGMASVYRGYDLTLGGSWRSRCCGRTSPTTARSARASASRRRPRPGCRIPRSSASTTPAKTARWPPTAPSAPSRSSSWSSSRRAAQGHHRQGSGARSRCTPLRRRHPRSARVLAPRRRRAPRHQAGQRHGHRRRPGEGDGLRHRARGVGLVLDGRRDDRRSSAPRRTSRPSRPRASPSTREPTCTRRAWCSTSCSPGASRSAARRRWRSPIST